MTVTRRLGWFVRRYFTEAQGVPAEQVVTRIEWRYLDEADA